MEQTISESRELPISTGATEFGPVVERNSTDLFVRFSDCDKDGLITFTGVLAFRFVPDISCSNFHLEAYSKICKVSNSVWLSELDNEAKQQGHKLSPNIIHYMIYFDHHGALEVAGTDCKIDC